MSGSLPTVGQGLLERDIEALSERIAEVPETRDLRSKCTRAYLKALLETKRQSLASLRNGQGARGDSV